jgi:hypothetical protein
MGINLTSFGKEDKVVPAIYTLRHGLALDGA